MALQFPVSLKKQFIIGVDLGADTAKLICLSSSKAGHKLIAHAFIRKDRMTGLREFLIHPELKQSEVRIAIQDPNIKIHKLSVPNVPKNELNQVVSWAFRDAAAITLEDYVVRFLSSKIEGETQTQSVTAFGMTKTHLAQWLKFAADAGITTPAMAEADIQSLANAVAYNYDIKENDRYAIIDIGKTQSQLAIVSRNGIEFFRPFSGIGGDHLAANLSHELSVEADAAERYMLELASDTHSDRHEEVLEVAGRYCAKFCVQAQYAIENYSAQSKDKPITNILLSGGGAKLKGLKEQIQDTLHLPTDLIDPFARIDLGNFNKNEFENVKTVYAVAAGLAL